MKVAFLGLALCLVVAGSACGVDRSANPGTVTTDRRPTDTATPAVSTSDPGSVVASESAPVAPGSLIHSELTFVDPTRPTVARPPVDGSPQRVLRTAVIRPDGAGGPWPLVVFGHGFDVSAATYQRLLDAIAGAGFVVAAPEFPGSSSVLPGRADEADLQQEPCDLRLVAREVEAASTGSGELAGSVRGGSVVLAGQSDGATAAAYATLVGVACPGPPVAGVVAFSPNPVRSADIDPAVAASGPALLAITGSADTVNPASHTAALYRQWPGPAWMLTSAADTHLGPSTDSPRRAAITAVVIDFLEAISGHPAAGTTLAAHAQLDGLTLDRR